jgi:uncharacterized protein (TIGR02466 family)
MIEFEQTEIMPAFPTFIFKGRAINLESLDDIKNYVIDLKEKEDPSIQCWQSKDNLHEAPELKDLTDLVLEQSDQILTYYGVIRDSHYITSMWANIYDPNIAHMMHMHPNSYLSGVIYINAPTDCGPIIFQDPRPGSFLMEFEYQDYNVKNASTLIEIPKKGMMLIWPSWLPHGVEIGKCKQQEKRISIAFNVMLKGSVNIPTKRLVF